MSAMTTGSSAWWADLPLTDWRSTKQHTADECGFELCEFCGCCAHGKEQAAGCKMDAAPWGCRCANSECGCEGRA
jgi:hypothetical protein